VLLKSHIVSWAHALGFADVGISLGPTAADTAALNQWLANGLHGDMDFMERWGSARGRIDTLVPEATTVISVSQPYFPATAAEPWSILNNPRAAYISRYALNRDYHKTMRSKLAKLAQHIEDWLRAEGLPFEHAVRSRAMVDSAPLMEKPAAREAGLGFIGRNTNLIHAKKGSWFFIGELVTNLPLPIDTPASAHCGTCQACLPSCPTGALTPDGHIDARRCISYFTIEHKRSIPQELRPLMGNRIYGCDDCQLVCPFNSFDQPTQDPDFQPRLHLDQIELLDLWSWTEEQFLRNFEGSPIRRIGYDQWMRNLAVALGNAPYAARVVEALSQRRGEFNELIQEHIDWALAQQGRRQLGDSN